ncbi:MAG: hypothetical protein HY296_05730 [Thaumarchaeota archaeon]|nr:hypothetical protein [Nitrososphaerota archaeon]
MAIKNSLGVSALVIALVIGSIAGYLAGSNRPVTVQTYTTSKVVTFTLESRSTYTLCTSTESLPAGCYRFFNSTFAIEVDTDGPWGLSYQSYLGLDDSAPLAGSGSFYGHGPAFESVRVAGPVLQGGSLCVSAEKLDSTSSRLILVVNPPSNVSNQTSLPYGVVRVCVGETIG